MFNPCHESFNIIWGYTINATWALYLTSLTYLG